VSFILAVLLFVVALLSLLIPIPLITNALVIIMLFPLLLALPNIKEPTFKSLHKIRFPLRHKVIDGMTGFEKKFSRC